MNYQMLDQYPANLRAQANLDIGKIIEEQKANNKIREVMEGRFGLAKSIQDLDECLGEIIDITFECMKSRLEAYHIGDNGNWWDYTKGRITKEVAPMVEETKRRKAKEKLLNDAKEAMEGLDFLDSLVLPFSDEKHLQKSLQKLPTTISQEINNGRNI